MRQRFLMRLFIAFLVVGLLSWGVSALSPDFLTGISAASAQDEAEADAEEEGSVEENAADEGDDDAEDAGDDAGEGDDDAENGGAAGPDDGSDPNAGMPPVMAVPTEPVRQAPDFSFSSLKAFEGYAALWKIIAAIIMYLIWVRFADWVSTDCIHYGFGVKKWVPIVYGSFWGGMILFWLIPFFWVSYLFLMAGVIAPLVIFVRLHNGSLSTGEQVLTPEHIRFVFAHMMAQIGVKVAAKARDKHEMGFAAVLNPYGKNKVETESWRIQARAHAGFPNIREIISKLMVTHPDALMLDYTANGVSTRYQVDGVWNAAEQFPRELADPALQALKILCGMKPEDRKNRQEGAFTVDFEYDYNFPEDRLKVKHAEDDLKEAEAEENKAKSRELERALEVAKEAVRAPEKRKRSAVVHITTQGVQGGERVLLNFEQGKSPFKTLEDLGMSSEMIPELKKQMSAKKGFFVFAAPAASGLRTTVKTALIKTDRYTREFYEIINGDREYDEVENVTQIPVKSQEPAVWSSEIRTLFLKDPDVVILRDIPTPEVMNEMLQEIEDEERFMITTVRAKDAAEALLRIMATKCDAEKWVRNVNGVLCQRLVRKLCEYCKEPYVPPTATLQQIGATEKIRIYRQPAPVQPKPGEDAPEPCAECRGLGYKGRVAMFELVVVGEETRKALLHTPKLELVRAALKKDGNNLMLQDGLRFVRDGVTSLQELKRALS